jgi:hypothetical protein
MPRDSAINALFHVPKGFWQGVAVMACAAFSWGMVDENGSHLQALL